MTIKKGDLVQYVSHHNTSAHNVIPDGKHPIGLVLEIKEYVIGENLETGAIMKTIIVKWSDEKWNTTLGVSEEFELDLNLIQNIS